MPSPTILPVRQRTPEWLEARMDGIGASEAAAAVGLSQWESRVGLWAHKLGLTPAREATMPMQLGVELEPFIARKYAEQTGVKVRRATQLRQHPEHRFMLASLDRRAGRKPIELKYSDRAIGYGEPGTDEVPDEVLVQMLHQLAVVDEPEGEVALLRPSRDELSIYLIRREAPAEAALIEEEAVFWDHVESRTEPPLDGSQATHRALAAIYPRDSGDVIEADEEARDLMAALRNARVNEDAWHALRDEREAALKAVIGEASRIVASGIGEITWRLTKDSETTDWKSLAAGYRNRLEEVVIRADMDPADRLTALDELDTLASIHTTTKPGVRRFVPKWDQEDS